MRRFTTRPTRPFPVADRTRDGHPYAQYHPRLDALRFLQERIADGKAGLDPYDDTIFVVACREDQRVRGYRALETVGIVLASIDTGDGGRRMRAILEADARHALHLDTPEPPLMDDEPLASRAATPGPGEAMAALLQAKAAYDRVYPDGLQRCRGCGHTFPYDQETDADYCPACAALNTGDQLPLTAAERLVAADTATLHLTGECTCGGNGICTSCAIQTIERSTR